MNSAQFLEPTQESGAALFAREITGQVVMLNLLRFRDVADYSASPELAPPEPVSGHDAYQAYMDHTLPFLIASGGEVLFLGEGGKYHWPARGAMGHGVARTPQVPGGLYGFREKRGLSSGHGPPNGGV